MSVIGVVATDNHWAIGKDNDLLFKIPEDMLFFKSITTGNTIIMGANTFKSLGSKPLPDRDNVVVTNHPEEYASCFKYDRLMFVSLKEAKAKIYVENKDGNVFIIGGSMIYNQLLPMCDIIYRTRYDKLYEDADKFITPFPLMNFMYDSNHREFKYDNNDVQIEKWINNGRTDAMYTIACVMSSKTDTNIITCDGGNFLNEYGEVYTADSDIIKQFSKLISGEYSEDRKITKTNYSCKDHVYCNMHKEEYSDGTTAILSGFSDLSHRKAGNIVKTYKAAFEMIQ